MKKGDKTIPSVVKVDIRIYPPISQPVTIRSVLYNADRQTLSFVVDAFIKFPAKKLNSDDAEDEPEYHAH